MREITILSGKGGTGKTSITAALASIAKDAVFCDNDVDASDLHLLLKPNIKEKETFFSGWSASINPEKCNACKTCIAYCRFNAIHINTNHTISINPFQCEGCLVCEKVCPSDAIITERNNNNYWYVSTTRFGTLVHAEMGPGEENSGKLVSQVRKKAKELATQENASYIINDGPPGIGCATISSLTGTNRVLIVFEPTKSGLHDAKRLVELIETFKIKTYAVINKYDINPDVSSDILKYLKSKNIPLLAQLPFDEKMVTAMTNGKTIIEYDPESVLSQQINDVWLELKT